jgi:signal transduction histidine kinase
VFLGRRWQARSPVADEQGVKRAEVPGGGTAAEALAEVRARLAQIPDPLAVLEGIFALAPVGLQVYRADGRSLLVNRAFLQIFGSEPPPEYNVLKDEIAERSGVLSLIHRAFAGETVHVPALWYDPRELTQVHVERAKRAAIEATFFPLFGGGGEVVYVAIIYREVTAEVTSCDAALIRASQEATRRAEEASRIKDEFLGIISHELRTPLNAILGWASILIDRSKDAELLGKGLAAIERNARAQVRIISDILDVSRIISGKLRLSLDSTEIEAVIREAIEAVSPAAEAKRIRVRAELHAPGAMILGDRARLHQVFWNVLTNAVKFTQAGGRVDVGAEIEAERAVVIRVTDTGVGISPELLPRVFDRFWQADSSTTRSYGGLGLGLAIVRYIIELHGGAVSVESRGVGHGSTFSIRLPLDDRGER